MSDENNIARIAFRFGVISLVSHMLAACVNETLFVDLTYPPEKEIGINDLDDVGNISSLQPGCDLELEVVDRREDKGRIGVAITGVVGESRAPLLTDHNVESWVRDAFIYELELLNIRVVETRQSVNEQAIDSLQVFVSDIDASCYGTGCNAEINFAAHWKKSDGTTWDAELTGKETDYAFLDDYATMSTNALRRALQEATRLLLHQWGVTDTGACSASRSNST